MTSTRYFRDIYYAKYYGKGGGEWSAGGKKLGVRGKNAKVERKKEENYIKKGEKGFKTQKISPRPPQTYLSGKKFSSQKRGGGESECTYIYLTFC